jgi:Rad3-related DNA helicase
MKATKTITWAAKDGRTIEVIIERTKEVRDNIVDADGDKVNLGKETVDRLTIDVRAGGKLITRTSRKPEVLNEKFYRNYKELRAKGVYARLGDAYINEGQYDMIMASLANIDAELTETPEYKEVKAAEEAKEAAEIKKLEDAAAEYKNMVKHGMCPKCGTWCYGDCEAH